MAAILFSGAIGPIPVSVVLTESHQSTLGITEQPVENGSKITDHAYVEPKRLTLEFADASAAQTYNTLVRFQESRVPFVVVSGLYVYSNMLIKALKADRDDTFSRILKGSAELQEVIIVETAYAAAEPGSDPTDTGKPGGTKSSKSAAPSKGRAGDAATKARASGPVQRGDSPAKTAPLNTASTPNASSSAVKNTSMLKQMFQ
ncbi:hypothetical protein HQ945_08335 [Phyllobacterium sp. BT25]|uniref:Dit-like phage tail protein N-terminal domain-containing protein n=1 Tax=Phyllobacterium pellucidum TaxID=2740464 RepID=A0A849VN52_9HYPH|nr:hypothetical protein [Phyllobacterium pellucidum]NTS31261.1 hypothetical protein [Phyllobacterium pellucidum]